MPLVAAAVCPQPPLLVPEVAAGAAGELDDLRAACDAALARVFAEEPGVVVLLGSGSATREYRPPYRASFHGWGADVESRLGDAGPDAPPLPLSLAIGVWLVGRAVDAGRVRRPTAWSAHTVAADATPDECAAIGARLGPTDDWALVVLGDGSACRGEKAPGYDDPRAEPFDKTVAQALATADAEGLLALDPALAADLRAAGRVPWQVLAGAVLGRAGAGATGHGDVLYEAAPYGVAYVVATWTRAAPTRSHRS